ncbi:MAG: acetyl-CoA carboxylase biotin carboxyl carrier protein [Clostridia bacterium]|nr:acetyl-CoA carboxylase biotin carboxyl carrier protein [Clostridia bacterium]
MKENDIRKYAGLMQELGLTGLEIKEENKVVRLEMAAPVAAKDSVVIAAPAAIPAAAAMPAAQESQQDSGSYISVKSPMVGVFYAAPAENTEPFVSIGDRVEKGKTLCIIEAMKLMNEITADEDGVIEKVCVTNGQVVDYGTELFRIRR